MLVSNSFLKSRERRHHEREGNLNGERVAVIRSISSAGSGGRGGDPSFGADLGAKSLPPTGTQAETRLTRFVCLWRTSRRNRRTLVCFHNAGHERQPDAR